MHYLQFADLNLPITITIGYLKKLALQIPWKNLYTHPTKLTIDGLYVHVIPKIEIEYNAKQDEKEQHEAKMKEVNKIEKLRKDKEAFEDINNIEKDNDTFSARMKLQIMQNLELLIHNIHIVYEDKTTKPNHPFAFGITLNYITFQTTNKGWIPTIIKENSPVIYKLGELNALSIYWNTNIKSNSNLPRNEIIKNLQTKIAVDTDQVSKDMTYIFRPFNVKTKLIMTMKPRQQKFERPMFYITIDLGHISLNLNRAQYLDILDLLEFQGHITAKLKYIKYRPQKFDKTIEKWIFAYNAILNEKIKPRLECYKWENIKKHLEYCREYRYIYVQELTGKITDEQKQRTEELEKKLDVFNLTYIRQRAQLENIQVDHDEDNNNKVILHDIINQSNKKKKKKRRRNSTLTIDHTIASVNNNIEINIQTSLTENCIIYRSKCPCDTHYNKQLIEHNYDLPVDKLFDLIFGSNEFVRTYRKAQHFFDQTETEWLINEETNYYERILDYKVPFETRLLGKSTIITREKQTRFHHVPGSHYVVETEVCNQGIKFSDTFALIIRCCLIEKS
ncbi:unnamed protein product [Rotaria sordida]|uniref:VASt domain-containing protein n=1 Tax=Rotaria sordida TaxID=392033 RepID=A0A815MJA3_9BILA|nr:unnamed protein product [Rotaria sordida]